MNLSLSYSAFLGKIDNPGPATVAQCTNHNNCENNCENPVAPATFTLLQATGKKSNAESTYLGCEHKRQELEQQVARLVRKVKLKSR